MFIKLESCGEETTTMLSSFDRIPEHDGRTDRQTDRQNCYINIDKNDKSESSVKYVGFRFALKRGTVPKKWCLYAAEAEYKPIAAVAHTSL